MNNQSGFITTEFIFALSIAFGMSIIVFAMTYSLAVIEVSQYVVFSAARAHTAAQGTVEEQKLAARSKYSQLTNSSGLASVYRNGWFTISPPQQLEIRSGFDTTFDQDYQPSAGSNREVFTGVRATLRVELLELNLPLLGRIVPEDDGFKTRVAGILIREPSAEECRDFFEKKKDEVWNINGGRFANFRGPGSLPDLWEDNGC